MVTSLRWVSAQGVRYRGLAVSTSGHSGGGREVFQTHVLRRTDGCSASHGVGSYLPTIHPGLIQSEKWVAPAGCF